MSIVLRFMRFERVAEDEFGSVGGEVGRSAGDDVPGWRG